MFRSIQRFKDFYFSSEFRPNKAADDTAWIHDVHHFFKINESSFEGFRKRVEINVTDFRFHEQLVGQEHFFLLGTIGNCVFLIFSLCKWQLTIFSLNAILLKRNRDLKIPLST